jgi:hypothetical protein
VIIFGKFGEGRAERNRTVAIIPNNAMRIVTPVSPLPRLPLSKKETGEGTKESSPLQMGNGPSRPVISDTNLQPLAAFLTGSASQTEIDVTRRKQTTKKFLTGARMHIKDLAIRRILR